MQPRRAALAREKLKSGLKVAGLLVEDLGRNLYPFQAKSGASPDFSSWGEGAVAPVKAMHFQAVLQELIQFQKRKMAKNTAVMSLNFLVHLSLPW